MVEVVGALRLLRSWLFEPDRVGFLRGIWSYIAWFCMVTWGEPTRARGGDGEGDDGGYAEAAAGRSARLTSMSSPAKRRAASGSLAPLEPGSIALHSPVDEAAAGCCSGARRPSRAHVQLGALALLSPLTLALATVGALGAEGVVGAMPRVFEFFRSISLSVLVLHTVWFDEMLIEGADAVEQTAVRCALNWPRTGCLARVFGCAAPSGGMSHWALLRLPPVCSYQPEKSSCHRIG